MMFIFTHTVAGGIHPKAFFTLKMGIELDLREKDRRVNMHDPKIDGKPI